MNRSLRSVIFRIGQLFLPIITFSVLLVWPAFAQEVDPQCMNLKNQWEQSYLEIKERVDKFMSLEQTPVEKVTKKPLVSAIKGRTIASQVSEALSEKEELLKSIRKETRNLLASENKHFTELQQCSQSVRSSKKSDFSGLLKKRKALLDKVVVCLSEVREVEGKETVIPYTEAYGQDAYRRSVNNQWQNYQDSYRGYWGY